MTLRLRAMLLRIPHMRIFTVVVIGLLGAALITASIAWIALAVEQSLRLRRFRSVLPIPLRDLEILASAHEDRAEAIKEFFEWKHKVLSSSVKAGVGFLLANLAAIIKLSFPSVAEEFNASNPSSREPSYTLLIAIGLVIIATAMSALRLRRVPKEYLTAVKLYTWMRG